MPIRRICDPTNIQCIWDAIKSLNAVKISTEHHKVLKELVRMNGYSLSEWEKCIEEALSDKLIVASSKNNELTYHMPDTEHALLDGKDWYCFECHHGGDVIFCKNKLCHRVYHLNCISKSALENFRLFKNLFTNLDSTVFLKKGLPSRRKTLCLNVDGIEFIESSIGNVPKYSFDNSLCIVCNMMNLKDFPLEKSELNYLFRYVVQRIRSWLPQNITHRMKGSDPYPEWQTQRDLIWRAKHLFFENMDMSVIEENVFNERYHNCHSLLKDVLTIKHNIGIYHGVVSQEYAATEFVLRDTLHDLGEIIGCVDCYKNSNEKINNNWFSIPCRVLHEIVWAKQKGYCYWPAKIIKESGNQCDVRFFGGKHERAVLSTKSIQPITRSKESLHLRKSVALTKAIEEMELHQKLAQNPSALTAFMANSKKKVSVPRKSRKSNSLQPPNISNMEDDENERPAPSRDEASLSELPELSSTSVPTTSTPKKKRDQLSLNENEGENKQSSDVGNEVPIKKRRGRSSSAKAVIAPASSENVVELPAKKRRGRRPKNANAKPNSTSKKAASTKKSNAAADKSIDDIEIINISDGEDNVYTYSGDLSQSAMHYSDNYEQQEQVTSSTECRSHNNQHRSQELQHLDHPYSDEVELMGRKLARLPNKKEIIKCAMNTMQEEIDRITEKHNEHLRKLFDSHNTQISETKKKQWCYYCEQDAIYHCCWNTAYCSTTCQQQHWHDEHKKVCRRKR